MKRISFGKINGAIIQSEELRQEGEAAKLSVIFEDSF
jgi:hypothetical protein